MQKATFITSIPHFFSRLFLQKANHTSFISRFKIHETLQIVQSNFLIFNTAFVQVL